MIKDDEPYIAHAVRSHILAKILNLANDRMIQGEILDDLALMGLNDDYNNLLFHVLESQAHHLYHIVSTAPIITLED